MDSLYHVKNEIVYVLSWWIVYALTEVLFCCLFRSLLRNPGNKHQTLLWVQKQFATRVHTLFSIYLLHLTFRNMSVSYWLLKFQALTIIIGCDFMSVGCEYEQAWKFIYTQTAFSIYSVNFFKPWTLSSINGITYSNLIPPSYVLCPKWTHYHSIFVKFMSGNHTLNMCTVPL